MTKKSLDGMILQRRESGNRETSRVFLDEKNGKISRKNVVKNAKSVEKVEISRGKNLKNSTKNFVGISRAKPQNADENLENDIETSLKNLAETGEISPQNYEKNAEKSAEKISRKDRKARKKAEKIAKNAKKHRAKKIVKWVIIAILLAVLAIGGYFAWKFVATAGQIFNGNPLDFTKKQELRKDENGRTNILIFGTSGYAMSADAYDGAFLTDSMMVLSVNQDTHDAYMVSLPRDLWVKLDEVCSVGYEGKLNSVYSCENEGGANENAGATALMKKIGEITGLNVQYYVHANWQAAKEAVEAVGGVDVEIDSEDPRGIYDCNTKLKLPNGENHLDGEAALSLVRARGDSDECLTSYGLAGGNFDREKNQRAVLVALQKKVLSAGTILNLVAVNNLLGALGDNLRTDFQTSEMQTLIDLAKNVKPENIKSLPLTNRADGEPDLVIVGMIGAQSVVLPAAGTYDYSGIQNYIAQNISANPVVRENAKIDVLNGSGEVGLAGKQADLLKNENYNVANVENAPENISAKVEIYQINSEKTATAAALAKKFGVKVKSGNLANYATDADFVIVFGPQN